MKDIIKITLLVGLLSLCGCDLFQPTKPNEHLANDVTKVTKVINISADDILASATKIDEKVIDIKQETKVATPSMAIIEKSADDISTESSKLKETSRNLSKAGVRLEISGKTIDGYYKRIAETEKDNEKLTKENTKLNEDMKSGLNKMLKWIVGGCVIGAGACAAMALFFGNIKGGLFGATTCIIVMVLAIAVGQYMIYIAIAGILAIIATLGVLGYQLFVQRRAISDNVWTQEVAKKHMSSDLKEKIYGDGKKKGKAGIIQSATTQKIVKNIKNNLPRGWKVTKED
jgi:hypothetical protein